jgi:hypothetical protein
LRSAIRWLIERYDGLTEMFLKFVPNSGRTIAQSGSFTPQRITAIASVEKSHSEDLFRPILNDIQYQQTAP